MRGKREGEDVRFVASAILAADIDAAALRARVARLPRGAVLDLRDLPAPEPMEKILEACVRLLPGAALAARTPRLPRMLLPHLDGRGLAWAALEEADGTGLVYVERPPAA